MARLFYSELRLGLASVGVSDLGRISRSRLNAGVEECSNARLGGRTEGVDRSVLDEELMSRTRGYALFIFHGRLQRLL